MNDKEKHQYDDIINLPHHVSTKHSHMSLQDRAAQFSPFAALTGHDAAIKEAGRFTEARTELDENSKDILDMRLQIVKEHLAEKPDITFTYFQPDKRKHGGSYTTVTGKVKKIDAYENRILLESGTFLSIKEIVAIDGKLFNMI